MSLRTNEPSRPIANDPTAHDLLRAAHHTQYQFPERFAGFKASVTFTSDGTSRGAVLVRAPRDIALDLETDEQSSGWVRQEIASIAGHRWPSSYEQGDGRWTLTLGPDDGNALGRQVLMHDDPFSSSYRLHDGRITEVTRTMGTTRFSIITQQHLELPDGRLLPSAFTVGYWDLEGGRLTKTEAYTDDYVEVDGVWLPQSRRVVTMDDNGLTARQITFTGHQLLADSASVITDVSARRDRSGA
jgi:hypothetical protein